jgi:hypothetical protein
VNEIRGRKRKVREKGRKIEGDKGREMEGARSWETEGGRKRVNEIRGR